MNAYTLKKANPLRTIFAISVIAFLTQFLLSCAERSNDENASVTVSLPEHSIAQLDQSVGIRAVTGKPEAINSIIISITTASGDPIGSGDILKSGNSITFSVPPHIDLVVQGTAYSGSDPEFAGQTSIPALWPGEQSNASFSLDELDPPLENTGIIAGTVRDAIDQEGPVPLANVQITVIDSEGSDIASATTDANGLYTIELPAGMTYSITFELANYLSASYANVLVSSGQTNNLEAVLQINTANDGIGSVTGQILDSLTGQPLPSVNLIFRQGINVTTGPIVTQGSTDAAGNYNIENVLTAGSYTCELSLTGYVTSYTTVVIIGNQINPDQNATLTPIPSPGSTRIVLTWGLDPKDLDSHLTGPITDNSAERFHIYYDNLTYPSTGAPGQGLAITPSAVDSAANLDIDDTDAVGPETMTITSQSPGVFRYSVHDFSNKGLTVSSALSLSGAKVEVFRENQLVRVFNVPNAEGTLWTVFELNGDVITPIDSMTYEPNETQISSVNPIYDGGLIANLPEK